MKVQNKGGKGNPNHDEEGKFTSADGVSSKSGEIETELTKKITSEGKEDDLVDSGFVVKAFNPNSIEDLLATLHKGKTQSEKVLESREIMKSNTEFLEFTTYPEENAKLNKQEKVEIIESSSMDYDKSMISNLTDEEIEAIFQSECIVFSEKQVHNDVKSAELEKEQIKKQIENELEQEFPTGAPTVYGVWAGFVGFDSYEDKAKVDESGTSAIDRKREYYQNIIDNPFGILSEVNKAQEKLNELNAWVKVCENYKNKKQEIEAKYIDAIEAIDKKINDIQKQREIIDSPQYKEQIAKCREFLNNYVDKNSAYSKKRKDNALWFKSDDAGYAGTKAYKHLAPMAEQMWKTMTTKEQNILINYTGSGYSKFNKPLRGINQDANGYSFNSSTGTFSQAVTNMTNAIDKCVWNEDIWVQRSINDVPIFLPVGAKKPKELGDMTPEELQSLVGTSFTDGGFYSSGAGKGTGFSGDVVFNTYCPRGTKMVYIAPHSSYGTNENEMILQRGYTYRITKVEKQGWKYYVDVEVVLGSDENKPVGNALKEIGNKHYYGPRHQAGEKYD